MSPPLFVKPFKALITCLKKYIFYFYRKYIKYRGYNPVGFGDSMELVSAVIKRYPISMDVIFEIGANFAQDADFLRKSFKIPSENVYVFEAHPEIYVAVKRIHKFNAYNYAVFNSEGSVTFNVTPLIVGNTGLSSLSGIKDDASGEIIETREICVKSIRMDNFLNNWNIERVSFLKLDVEGFTYEVLEGFGERIQNIDCMHIEAEHKQGIYYTRDVRLFDDIAELLRKNNFELIYFQRYNHQSDSMWIHRKYFKKNVS